MPDLLKYPRTRHIEGSRLQPGDEDLDAAPFSTIRGRPIVLEEKIDGANSAVSFDDRGNLLLQSRGHFLTGGLRERHFNLLKSWATTHTKKLWGILGSRYIMYGEWLYAKHTIYYDRLPHYFLEFDIFDTEARVFLSTERRHAMLADSPVCSVPVLGSCVLKRRKELEGFVTTSLYKTPDWREQLRTEAVARGLDVARTVAETDPSDTAEGLYIKVEEDGIVTDRYKWIRVTFLTSVLDSGTHWLERPLFPNMLAAGVDIFSLES